MYSMNSYSNPLFVLNLKITNNTIFKANNKAI